VEQDEKVAALLRQASGLAAAGRIGEAVAAYRQALSFRPALPNSWFNLARLERLAGEPEAALASYAEALGRGVEGPEEAHLNRAIIFAEDLLRAGEAEAELKAALALRPGWLPALLNLGNLREDVGDRAGAREAYSAACRAAPGDGLALARLIGVSELSGADDPLLVRAAARAARTSDPSGRADLGFALGAALDRVGAFDAAFAAYSAANAASRAASGAAYDRRAQERFVDRSVAAFQAPEAPRPGLGGGAPLFICGMFRSGSTLAEQILARHPLVSPGGELGLIPRLAAGFSPYPEDAAAAADARIGQCRQAYAAAVRGGREGHLLTDKRPDNFLHIGLIKRLFPEARIVHTVRQPLDNLLSLYFLHLDPGMAYALDLEDCAHWYRQYRRLMDHWRRLYPGDIYELDYDRLVAEPRATVEGLLRFCGLPWDEACLSFEQAANPVRTASASQVREKLYTRSSRRWRNYERHLGPLAEALRGP
jgi:tetratricopeptide (TPR) repeat protein